MPRLRPLLLAALALLALTPAAGAASDPWLDPGFGTAGVASRTFTGAIGTALVGAVRMPDGDVVVAFEPAHTLWGCCLARVGGLALARVASDGTPRASFGTAGVVQPATSARTAAAGFIANDVAADGSGRILLVGRLPFTDDYGTPAVQRRDAQGRPDPAFGDGGTAELPVPAACAQGHATYSALAVVAGGKALAVGSCSSSAGFKVLLARLGPGGAPDASFGTGGVRTIALPGVGACCSPTVRRYPGADGRLAVGLGSNHAVVMRLLADGVPDPAFGGDGLVSLDALADGGASSVLPLAGGGMVVTLADYPGIWSLARVTATGAVDPAFARSGPQLPSDCGYPSLLDLAGDAARVVVAVSCVGSHRLVAVDGAGLPDATYGEHALVATTYGADDISGPHRILLPDADGLLVAGGLVPRGAAVERHGSDGALDTAWADGGLRRLAIAGSLFDLDAADAQLDAARRLVVVAKVGNRGHTDEGALLVTRFRPDGRPDASFGSGGSTLVEAGGWRDGDFAQRGEAIGAPSLALLADGRIAVVARWTNEPAYGIGASDHGLLVARLSAAGRPDTALGPRGAVIVSIPDASSDDDVDALPAAGGALLVSLLVNRDDGRHPAVVRVTAGGALDAGFGTGGLRVLPDSANAGGAPRFLPLPGGAGLLAWERFGTGSGLENVTRLARIGADGAPEPTWAGGTGRVEIPFTLDALGTGADGAIVAAWDVRRRPDDSFDGSADLRVRRLRADGTPLPGFGTGGTATIRTDPSGSYGFDRPIAVGVAGARTLVLGDHGRDGVSTRRLWRLDARGALDASFGAGGRVRVKALDGNVGGVVTRLVVGPDGAAMTAEVPYDRDHDPERIELVRVLPAVPVITGPAPGVVLAPAVRLAWGGVGGPYVLERRDAPAGGSFAPWTAGRAGAATSARVGLRAGVTSCLRVRAAAAAVSAARCYASPLGVRRLAASKGWRTVRARSAVGGAFRVATARGATLGLRAASGRTVVLVARRCPGCGAVEVRLGGKVVGRASLAGRARASVPIVVATFPAVRSGRLQVRVTTRGKPVRIEALGVWRDDA